MRETFKSLEARSIKSMPVANQDIHHTYIIPCQTHRQKLLKLYCSFCEKPICETCKTTKHVRHMADIKGMSALVIAAQHRRNQLAKLLKKKEDLVVHSYKSLIMHLTNRKASLHSQVENAFRRYQNYSRIHRDKLLMSDEEWIDDVKFRGKKYFVLIDEKIEYLQLELRTVFETLGVVQRELEGANDTELLLIFRTLQAGLLSLYDLKWPVEEITVSLRLESVPAFGPMVPHTDTHAKNMCTVEFSQKVIEPIVYERVLDTRLPIPDRVLQDENAKVSICSADDEMFVAFGEYIIEYPLHNRRYTKVKQYNGFTSIMTVRQNIIDLACDRKSNVYFISSVAVKLITSAKKQVRHCFTLVNVPSALALCKYGESGLNIYVAFHDTGKIVSFSSNGRPLMELTHPDPKMVYRPRHLDINLVGEIFFSDDISNVTILDRNGIWKGAISRDAKTTSMRGLLRPTGISCSPQRHVFLLDSSPVPNLHIFSEDGKYLQTAVFKSLYKAYVLKHDRSGDIWVAFKDGRIRIYRPRAI